MAEPEKLESPEDARAFDHDGILQRIEEAEKALDSGLPEAAFLLAWSACEAAIRVSLAAEGVITPGITLSRYVFDQAVSHGVISRDEYHNLIKLQKHRNAIAHGFSHENFNVEMVTDLIDSVRQMMLLG